MGLSSPTQPEGVPITIITRDIALSTLITHHCTMPRFCAKNAYARSPMLYFYGHNLSTWTDITFIIYILLAVSITKIYQELASLILGGFYPAPIFIYLTNPENVSKSPVQPSLVTRSKLQAQSLRVERHCCQALRCQSIPHPVVLTSRLDGQEVQVHRPLHYHGLMTPPFIHALLAKACSKVRQNGPSCTAVAEARCSQETLS